MTRLKSMRRLVMIISLLMAQASHGDCVILLHGLIRSADSMNLMEEAFEQRGYRVANVDYPSRQAPVESLAPLAVEAGLKQCDTQPAEKIHFVTHSLGGILVRYYLAGHKLENLGRVVMLAPPNRGSEVVDNLGKVPGFELINGPAGQQLGTDPQSIPSLLGPVDYPVGVIAGTRTINPILSQYLPNPDDGKVSLANTMLEGMTGFIAVPASHTFIMRDETVIQQTIEFIETGAFSPTGP